MPICFVGQTLHVGPTFEGALAMPEESDKFVPGTETAEQFTKVLGLLCEWVKGGVVSVDVDSDGELDFDFPREMQELLAPQLPKGLTSADVRGIARLEIRTLAAASLSQRPRENLARMLPEQIRGDLNEMVRRCDEVDKQLITPSLKQRMLLRRATSAVSI